jgi:hypothetical protein
LDKSTFTGAGGTIVAAPDGAAVAVIALGAAELLPFDEELPELHATAMAARIPNENKKRRFKAYPP